MSPPTLNLASRPFQNLRPVGRLSATLWFVVALLVAGNLWFYGRYAAGAGTQESTRTELQGRIADAETGIAELEREIGRHDLTAQNAHVEFLNRKIGQRVFGWSQLFDRLSEVLPNKVRLTRLSPDLEGAEGPLGEQYVSLQLSGVARSGEDLLKLVDALFRHPRFRRPYLASESTRQNAGGVEFRLSVQYQPAGETGRHKGEKKPSSGEAQEELVAVEPVGEVGRSEGKKKPGSGEVQEELVADEPAGEAGRSEGKKKPGSGEAQEELVADEPAGEAGRNEVKKESPRQEVRERPIADEPAVSPVTPAAAGEGGG